MCLHCRNAVTAELFCEQICCHAPPVLIPAVNECYASGLHDLFLLKLKPAAKLSLTGMKQHHQVFPDVIFPSL